jgi:ubiquinone/menaquinone biosynthesis C-methylase UbiE
VAHRPSGYVPAASYDLFLPLYDPVLRWLMREDKFKTRLLEQADLQPGHRVLDLGCGTATLALLAKRREPEANVFAVDGDPKVLAVARRKVAGSGLSIHLGEALAGRLPYPDASFDRVLSSLVFHHLTRAEKMEAFGEVRRVLAKEGSLHLVDFGPPAGWASGVVTRLLSRGERIPDNLEGRLGELIRAAGFEGVQEHGYHSTPLGTLVFLSASAITA